jgi:hypothetical protein
VAFARPACITVLNVEVEIELIGILRSPVVDE